MPRGKPNPIRTNNGIKEKLCYGTLHSTPTFVPCNQFSKRGDKLKDICKSCDRERRAKTYNMNIEPWVQYPRIEFAVIELVRRLGKVEAARRIGISQAQMWNYLNKKTKFVKKRTAVQIILTLYEVRKKGEVRHRASIHHGAELRGRKERVPTSYRDYYVAHGDSETDKTRAKRRLDSGKDS